MRRLACLLSLLLVVLVAVGCGKKKQAESGEVDGYIYIPAVRGETVTMSIWPEPYEPETRGVVEYMALGGAEVSIVGTDISVFTDENGYFLLSKAPRGRQTLIVKYGEADPVILLIDVLAGQLLHASTRTFVEPASEGEAGQTSDAAASLQSTRALGQLVLKYEKQPGSGAAIAELAAGTDLSTAQTAVTVSAADWELVGEEHKQQIRQLLTDWNQVVRQARTDAGYEEDNPLAPRTRLRDERGGTLLAVPSVR